MEDLKQIYEIFEDKIKEDTNKIKKESQEIEKLIEELESIIGLLLAHSKSKDISKLEDELNYLYNLNDFILETTKKIYILNNLHKDPKSHNIQKILSTLFGKELSSGNKTAWFEDILEHILNLLRKEETSIRNIIRTFRKIKETYNKIRQLQFSTHNAKELQIKVLHKLENLQASENILKNSIKDLESLTQKTLEKIKRKEELKSFKIGQFRGPIQR